MSRFKIEGKIVSIAGLKPDSITLGQLKKESGLQEDVVLLTRDRKPVNGNNSDFLSMLNVKSGDQFWISRPTNTTTTTTSTTGNTKDTTTSKKNILYQNNSTDTQVGLPSGNGILVLREQPDDNSCLFHSIKYALKYPSSISSLRDIIANHISQSTLYNDAFLGMPKSTYMEKIKSKDSWGGAIELAIFANHFNVEINSIDIATNRSDTFVSSEEETKTTECIFLLYSGIHYDTVAITPQANAPKDFDQTKFDIVGSRQEVMACVLELAKQRKAKRKYTDLANFTLKCGVCFIGIVGQKDAQEHAIKTGHQSFTEY